MKPLIFGLIEILVKAAPAAIEHSLFGFITDFSGAPALSGATPKSRGVKRYVNVAQVCFV